MSQHHYDNRRNKSQSEALFYCTLRHKSGDDLQIEAINIYLKHAVNKYIRKRNAMSTVVCRVEVCI